MIDIDRVREAAEREGFELGYVERTSGGHEFGLLVFVRMSERRLDHCGGDADVLQKAAADIKRGLQTVSAKLDPKVLDMRLKRRAEIAGIYAEAGVSPIYMEELPNGCCSEPCCLNDPWFRVTSRIGHVVIGWRRSVISIDWKDSVLRLTGASLFQDESAVRWAHGIHAHGAEKAADYIRRLHEGT